VGEAEVSPNRNPPEIGEIEIGGTPSGEVSAEIVDAAE
jgi:hypothetical protein